MSLNFVWDDEVNLKSPRMLFAKLRKYFDKINIFTSQIINFTI